jgi:hypothetical protein
MVMAAIRATFVLLNIILLLSESPVRELFGTPHFAGSQTRANPDHTKQPAFSDYGWPYDSLHDEQNGEGEMTFLSLRLFSAVTVHK